MNADEPRAMAGTKKKTGSMCQAESKRSGRPSLCDVPKPWSAWRAGASSTTGRVRAPSFRLPKKGVTPSGAGASDASEKAACHGANSPIALLPCHLARFDDKLLALTFGGFFPPEVSAVPSRL